jgi:tyrosyl-tRNA synthetase
MEWKLELARRITGRWHGEGGALAGEAHFTRVVRRHEAPEEMPEAAFVPEDGAVYLPALLQEVFGKSSSHWRRQIDQGGVKLNGEAVAAYEVDPGTLEGAVLQAGKRQFARLRSV